MRRLDHLVDSIKRIVRLFRRLGNVGHPSGFHVAQCLLRDHLDWLDPVGLDLVCGEVERDEEEQIRTDDSAASECRPLLALAGADVGSP